MSNIFIVDDREDFVKQFIELAGTKQYKVASEKSFDGLKRKMPTLHNKIAVIILDIKCLLTDDQEIEDQSFISTALSYLDTNYPKFPRIILTGDDSAFVNFQGFFKNEDVFLKTPEGLNLMFEKIKYYSDNSEDLKIRRDYMDVFKIFEDNLMESTQETQVLSLLKKLDEKNITKYKGILTNIRSVQEMIYKQINKKDKTVVPDNMFKSSGMINFNKLMKHLNGYPVNYIPTRTVYQNNTISNFSNSLYWSCGEYIHEEANRQYMISNMALKSLIFNLMELLIWSKQYLR